MVVLRIALSLSAFVVFLWAGLWLIWSGAMGYPAQLQVIGATFLLSAPVWGVLVYLVIERLWRPAVEQARR